VKFTESGHIKVGIRDDQESTGMQTVGNWHFYNGDEAKGMEIFRQVVEQQYWSAFGYIAAEAELAR